MYFFKLTKVCHKVDLFRCFAFHDHTTDPNNFWCFEKFESGPFILISRDISRDICVKSNTHGDFPSWWVTGNVTWVNSKPTRHSVLHHRALHEVALCSVEQVCARVTRIEHGRHGLIIMNKNVLFEYFLVCTTSREISGNTVPQPYGFEPGNEESRFRAFQRWSGDLERFLGRDERSIQRWSKSIFLPAEKNTVTVLVLT